MSLYQRLSVAIEKELKAVGFLDKTHFVTEFSTEVLYDEGTGELSEVLNIICLGGDDFTYTLHDEF